MPFEIEHKYLVKQDLWSQVVSEKSFLIKQGYLSTDPEKTVRVRIKDSKGFLAVKSKLISSTRLEYEYEIPLLEAEEMITNLCSGVIEKTRHLVIYKNNTWEVDVFAGSNQGLIVAEIELNYEQEFYEKPDWLALNVTDDPKYANSNLTVRPYKTW